MPALSFSELTRGNVLVSCASVEVISCLVQQEGEILHCANQVPILVLVAILV